MLEWINVGASVAGILAFVVSFVSLIISYCSAMKQEKSDKVNMEFNIRNLINSASSQIHACAFARLNSPKDSINIAVLESAQEEYRNAYEEACEKYLNGKIDKAWFRDMYSIDIKQLVEDPVQKPFYTVNSSHYQNTVQVYREWFKVNP